MGWVAAGVGAVGCLAGAGAAVAALYGLTAKAQRPRRLPNTMEPPVPYETVEWRVEGRKVLGWMLPVPGRRKSPAVVIAHGWASNRSRVLRYAAPLREAGYAVLMYDARGHGESDPHPAPSGLMFREDLLAALEWLRDREDIDERRIGVLGHSLGGFGAVLALEEAPPIAALVADSMPVRFSTMIGSELRRRKLPVFPLVHVIQYLMARRSGIGAETMKRADPSRILQRNSEERNIPVMLMHSRLDTYVPSTEMEYVLARNPSLPHLYLKSEGHSVSDTDPAFWPAVLTFFDRHLRRDKENGLAASAASPSR